jgi:hypothetical protein
VPRSMRSPPSFPDLPRLPPTAPHDRSRWPRTRRHSAPALALAAMPRYPRRPSRAGNRVAENLSKWPIAGHQSVHCSTLPSLAITPRIRSALGSQAAVTVAAPDVCSSSLRRSSKAAQASFRRPAWPERSCDAAVEPHLLEVDRAAAGLVDFLKRWSHRAGGSVPTCADAAGGAGRQAAR